MTKQINYPHLASMAFNTPLYATNTVVDAVKSVLVPRMQDINVSINLPDVKQLHQPGEILSFYDEDNPPTEGESSRQSPCNGDGMYTIAKENVAVVPVHGVLVPRRGIIENGCTEVNSYERIRNNIQRALNYDAVKEIVLDLNSGGGAAVGCKELADFIFEAQKIKPITALVNFAAYSACYFIAAACSKIVMSQTSGVGSIGVIMEHMEVSKWEEQVGLKFTTLYRGDHKNDGSPHEQITEQTLQVLDKRLDDAYDMFVDSVAQYRGMDRKKVIDTQAGLMSAQEAITLGFADEMQDPISAISTIAQPYLQAQQRQPSTRLSTRAQAMNMATQL